MRRLTKNCPRVSAGRIGQARLADITCCHGEARFGVPHVERAVFRVVDHVGPTETRRDMNGHTRRAFS